MQLSIAFRADAMLLMRISHRDSKTSRSKILYNEKNLFRERISYTLFMYPSELVNLKVSRFPFVKFYSVVRALH